MLGLLNVATFPKIRLRALERLLGVVLELLGLKLDFALKFFSLELDFALKFFRLVLGLLPQDFFLSFIHRLLGLVDLAGAVRQTG